MAGDDRESEKPFKVQDRRRFSSTGEARPESEVEAAETPPPAAAPEPPADAAPQAPTADDYVAHSGEHAELTFATFVISLSTQALALLGEIPDPVQGRTVVDLEGARQFIDILGILQDKTRGNLDPRENALLDGALYDLRMKYVERSGR